MQLVAYGAQDIYLTGNPQITFFKVVYRRHTNFSMESIQQTSSGSGTNKVVTISRNGDLVHKMYLCHTADSGNSVPDDGKAVERVELEIGGQRIDRQTGEWMRTWNELSTPESKAIGLKAMTGNIGSVGQSDAVSKVHIPLLFWFCRNPGLALPLIALQYHEVKVKITYSAESGLELFCDYIYLDTDERRRFAQVSHEYLIEQVQEQSVATDNKQKLNFNHPVKELIWRLPSDDTYTAAQLKLNGHDRFSSRGNEYFELQQPFDYHTAVPRQNLPRAAQLTNSNESVNAAAAPGSLATVLDGGGVAAAGDADNSIVTAPGITAGTGAANYQLVITDVTSEVAAANPGGSITSVDGTAGFATPGVLASSLSPEIWTAATASRQAAMQLAVSAGVNFSTFAGRKVRISGANLLGGTNPTGDGILDAVILAAFPVTASDSTTADAFGIDETSALVYFDRPVFTVATNGTSSTTITAINLFESNLESISQARTSQDTAKIGVYSFALKPEEHQPSGTCNFSRIDNAELTLTGHSGTVGFIYAVNYNVLRIMSGMGGLAYSN